MKIILSTDDNYAPHAATVIESIINNSNSKFDFVILYCSLNNEIIHTLKEHLKGRVASINFYQIKEEELIKIPIPNKNTHFSISTYLRLFVPLILPNDNLVLYLDSDIIVLDDIKKIKLEIKDDQKPVFAVEETYHHLKGLESYKEYIGIKHETPIFNAGILIMNLDIWRKEKISEKIIDFIVKNPDKLKFVDQDAINAVINGNFGILNPRWNVHFNKKRRYDFLSYKPEEIDHSFDNAAIVHFVWILKPWKYITKHPYKKYYWKYRQLTPWPTKKQEEKTFLNIIKKYTPLIIKQKIRRIIQ